CCREVPRVAAEVEIELPQRSKAVTPVRFPHPFRCAPLRHSSISPAPVLRSSDLRNGYRHLRVPIRREFQLCPRSSPRDYPEANLRQPNPDTFPVRKLRRKRTATLPCPQACEPATLDCTGCARNPGRPPAQECRRSHYPARWPRLANTRVQAVQAFYRLLWPYETMPRNRRRSDDCNPDAARLGPSVPLENPRPRAGD